MELTTMENMGAKQSKEEEGDEEPIKLPGFRFHPTDEELVSFYLKRKVEKKPVEVIKPIDIYKYDPWDLPKVSNVGDKEWYFFCMRGRKYRNSIRPNRVTGSGFWKATGIDKPIYSAGDPHDCIGLKKSLVYYRGNAGKGTKTDWMMHEFRLPPASKSNPNLAPRSTDIAQEAEVWTLCRIFKRIPSHRKYTPDPKQNPVSRPAKHDNPTASCSKTSSGFESEHSHEKYYVSFGDSAVYPVREPWIPGSDGASAEDRNSWFLAGHHFNSIAHHHPTPFPGPYRSHPGFLDLNGDDRLTYGNSWDELTSVVEVAMHHHSHVFDCT